MGHFQGIGIKKIFFFQNIFCQKMFNNEISTHKLCPKSGLKHSVVHSQGIGKNFKYSFFAKYFLSKDVQQ